MKQTAVEWLVEQFNTTINYTMEEYQLKIDQAKAMEKEQIMEAHYAPKYGCFSEQYYNETYESNTGI
jgi:hypothetical protein